MLDWAKGKDYQPLLAYLALRESIAKRYDELTRSLDKQLGLEPTRETRLMYRQLLGQA